MGITQRSFQPGTGKRRERYFAVVTTLAGSAVTVTLGVPAKAGFIKNTKVAQIIAGLNGTSHSTKAQVQPSANGTAKLANSTGVSITLAAGANVTGDCEGQCPVQTGVTAGVMDTTGAGTAQKNRFAAGDILQAVITPTGTYSATLPTIQIEIEIEYVQ